MDWGTVVGAVVAGVVALCSALIGGAAALLGTVVAHHLQSRAERGERRRERLEARLGEVVRYVVRMLRMVDLLCDAVEDLDSGLADDSEVRFSGTTREDIEDCLKSWEYSPLSGSPEVMYVRDDELRQLLSEIDRVSGDVADGFRQYLEDEESEKDVFETRDELKELAGKVSLRVDRLVDST